MKKERKTISVSKLKQNDGQLPWLPKNPRKWTPEDVNKTVSSIKEDPDFLEDRPLLVVEIDNGFYLIFAGNLRRESAPKAGLKVLPCVVYTPENEEDHLTIKRRAMKDNGSFGSWDVDELQNWKDMPLGDWGIEGWGTEPSEDLAGGGPALSQATEDEFDEEEDEVVAVCAKGDIWQLGDHRLMCGNSTDPEALKTLMGGVQLKQIWYLQTLLTA